MKILKNHFFWIVTIALVLVVLLVSKFLFGDFRVDHQKEIGLRIGVDLSPLDFRVDSTGSLSGLQYDLVETIFTDTLIDWKIYLSRDKAIEDLQRGEIDIYAASYPMTSSFSDIPGLLPTSPLYISGYALIRKKGEGSPWAYNFHQEDTIYIDITRDVSVRMLLENLREISFPLMQIREHEDLSVETLCLSVAEGTISYTVCDRNIAREICDRIHDIEAVSDIAFDLYQVWLMSKDRENLWRYTQDRIDVLLPTSKWKSILNKWGVDQ